MAIPTHLDPGRLGASLALALALLAPSAVSAEGDSPEAVVDGLHATLLEVMKNADALGYQGRFDKISPVLKERFDTRFMAQKSVGRHWKQLGDADRVRLLVTFDRFMTANYAGRFNAYSGQQFVSLREEPSLHGTVLVHTQLLSPGDEPVQLNYRLRPVKESWKIIDVYLNGTVSELALRRSEYSSLIKREGIDALIAALDEKIANLETSAPEKS